MRFKNLIGVTRNSHAKHTNTNQVNQAYITVVNLVFKKIFAADYRFQESLGQLTCLVCNHNRIAFCIIKNQAACLCGFRSNVTRLFFLSLMNFIGGRKNAGNI